MIISCWIIDSESLSEEKKSRLSSFLSANEIARKEKYLNIEDQNRHVVARASLRIILARYFHISPLAVALEYGENGKPAVLNQRPQEDPLFFNIAHSGGTVLIGVCIGGDIGVDIEKIKDIPEMISIARTIFSPMELEGWISLPYQKRINEFFKLWTCREAFLKCIGTGFSAHHGPVDLDIDLSSIVSGNIHKFDFLDQKWVAYCLEKKDDCALAIIVRSREDANAAISIRRLHVADLLESI